MLKPREDHSSRAFVFGRPPSVGRARVENTVHEFDRRRFGQGRTDDNPETVRERLRVYHEETEPLVEHYERQGKLRRIDGAQSPDAVHDDVRAALGYAAG